MSVFRLLLIASAVCLLAAGTRAQVHSSSFDPKCYQPQIGLPGVIDTIVGRFDHQHLGASLMNIGAPPSAPGLAGRLMMFSLPGAYQDTSEAILTVGAAFDPKHLTIKTMHGLRLTTAIPGHFRSGTYTDLLAPYDGNDIPNARIYWQLDDGSYDSSSYTTLQPYPNAPGQDCDRFWTPYHAKLTSDSIEDIVMMCDNGDYHKFADSAFLCLFNGSHLHQPGAVIAPDERIFFDSTKNIPQGYLTYQGDFRGSGRVDLVTDERRCNMLFYRNDQPFSLLGFANALRADTIYAAWEDGWVNYKTFGMGTVIHSQGGGTPAEDIVFSLDTDSFPGGRFLHESRIFLGGPSFGKRLTMSDTRLLRGVPYMDSTSSFGELGWGRSFTDCGDMAGTGDHVLCVTGDFPDFVYYAFYVMGDTFDDYVDMWIGQPDGELDVSIDTARLDGSKYQDVAIGVPIYPSVTTDGMFERGTVLFVHGSDSIPVKTPRSVRRAEPASALLAVVRDDVLEVTLPDGSPSGNRLWLLDILGRTVRVWSGAGNGEVSLPLSALPHGTYFIHCQSSHGTAQARVQL